MTALLLLLGAAVVGTVAFIGVFLAGMRANWSPVVNAVRRFNLMVMNPRQMRTAGQPGAFAQILRHTGRTSGVTYETPLGIEPTDDGFVIALVYGNDTQWLRNVLAAARAEVVRDDVTYAVDRPRVVPVADLIDFFKPSDRRLFRLFGVEQCLQLYHATHD
jgi:deazaflavin-dependent oxidoreductase (nitroreductase family)